MSLQLDRRGAWNMMGPCLFAFAVMATMWVRSWGNLMLLAHTPSLVTGVGAWSLHSVGEQSPAPHSGHASHPGPESCTPAECHRWPPWGPVCFMPEDPSGLCAGEPPPSSPHLWSHCSGLGRLGLVASPAPSHHAHVAVFSRYTAVGTGATATPPPGSAGPSASCLASAWLLWPLPSILL